MKMCDRQVHRWFPMFFDLRRWRVLVVGGGKIAQRRIQTLLEFEPGQLRIVAREVESKIKEWKNMPGIDICEREYRPEDLNGCRMVLAATDDPVLNQTIGAQCRELGILVNVASDQNLCDFHFPGVALNGPITVGVNAAGLDHRLARKTREQIQGILNQGGTMQEKKRQIVIGSRESKLAVVQSEMVADYLREQYPEWDVRLLTMKTTGDIILDRTLDEIGGKGLFVKELDKALLDKRSDLSVHSLKDMPMEIPDSLPLVAFSKREDPRDVLVLPEGCTELEEGKTIGCSSLRRQLQLAKLFPNNPCKNIRGNVLTRLNKLDRGEYDALVLAGAGLKRLGLENRISRYFDPEEMIPAAGQGILAIQGRAGEDYSYLDGYGNPEGRYAALAERAFVRELDGGCTSPVAAHARITGNQINMKGLYYRESTKEWYTDRITGTVEEAEMLGRSLAKEMKERFGV